MVIVGFLALGFGGMFLFGYRHYLKRQRVVEAAAESSGNTIASVNVEKVRRAATTTVLTLPGNITPLTEAFSCSPFRKNPHRSRNGFCPDGFDEGLPIEVSS